MENGKAFRYVPIYSLPINPCSALVPSALCMHIAFPLHIRSISQSVLTSAYLLYGLCPKGSTVPAFPEEQLGEAQCPWGIASLPMHVPHPSSSPGWKTLHKILDAFLTRQHVSEDGSAFLYGTQM